MKKMKMKETAEKKWWEATTTGTWKDGTKNVGGGL